jgi:hypothetical protein
MLPVRWSTALPSASDSVNKRLFMALALGLAGLLSLWVYDYAPPANNQASETIIPTNGPPPPPPMTVRPLAPAVALKINSQIPFSPIPNPPARPFVFRGGAAVHHRALSCLTAAIYYEAASEPEDGQRAVAQVVLNRVRHPAYPGSICAVVYQGSTLPTGCQFTFTCDGSLDRGRAKAEWTRAESIAAAALAGKVFAPVGNALNYHANFVVPYWAKTLAKKAIVGTHIFYRLPGFWGEERAFRRPYRAVEADPVTLRATALAARQRRGTSVLTLPKPLISVEVDPRIELLGVVDMLARRSAGADGQPPVMKAARADFAAFSNHLAVEIYRQLASRDEQLMGRLLAQIVAFPAKSSEATLTFPALVIPGQSNKTGAGLAEALGTFAKDSKFLDFFDRQQSNYQSLKDANLASALPVVANFQNYTGIAAGSIRLFVTPMVQRSFVANCYSQSPGTGSLTLFAGDEAAGAGQRSAMPEAATVLLNALAQKMVVPNSCGLAARGGCTTKDGRIAVIQDQIARQLAVHAIQANSSRAPVRNSKGPALPLAISEALRSYEQNRRWFPTYRDFQPVLLQSLATSERLARTPNGSAAASLTLPASVGGGGRRSDPVCEAFKRGNRA